MSKPKLRIFEFAFQFETHLLVIQSIVDSAIIRKKKTAMIGLSCDKCMVISSFRKICVKTGRCGIVKNIVSEKAILQNNMISKLQNLEIIIQRGAISTKIGKCNNTKSPVLKLENFLVE